jgi:hypothetical protein
MSTLSVSFWTILLKKADAKLVGIFRSGAPIWLKPLSDWASEW